MPAGIRAVCYESVGKLTEPVYQATQSQNYTETGIFYTILGPQDRHSKREVLPHEIEHGISYHRADDDLPLPVVETPFCLHC